MSGQVDRDERAPLQTMPWWVAVIGAAAVAVSATATTLWLLSIAGHDASLRIEAIKIGLSVGAGTGGAVALLLAVRRQWLSERTQAHAEDVARITHAHAEAVARDNAYDATQRRVTELYGKAVEQLGHANAPVRLGGLYSLERLAQDHSEHRQTVVDVVCAYLRMPFNPPLSVPAESQKPLVDKDVGSSSAETRHGGSDVREELQVRLAAQRMLARHLALSDDRSIVDQHANISGIYWDGMRIDLNGAHLVEFDLAQCRLGHADFRYAQFSGGAIFTEAQFDGDVMFDGAQFGRYAMFAEAQFDRCVTFDGVRFHGDAIFIEARFDEDATFVDTQFNGDAIFSGANFSKHAGFGKARFGKDVKFVSAKFDGGGLAWFDGVEFSTRPDFTGALARHPGDRHSWPDGWHIHPGSPSGMAPLVRQ
ncbi:pentapeptide repeat-containing protein [Actinoallomurus acaciae]|uniref:Pentapeptide repeat-containing protein n=1 Tax=Actinoallomurus acaciae TaxID=502577 RepID=A0ABV5Y6W5_9ACTN